MIEAFDAHALAVNHAGAHWLIHGNACWDRFRREAHDQVRGIIASGLGQRAAAEYILTCEEAILRCNNGGSP